MLYLYILIPNHSDSTMIDNDHTKKISEAQLIARRLNELLHDDACYRLQLKKNYSPPVDNLKWTESIYTRCQLAEALCRKLSSLHP
ncbi:MAG: hypothetical protein ACI9XC_001030 [Gammaproteobacteria bacterium]|jgi:hypothetical protein